jgi:murein DD-endopeptidase MepM/ murein hydrolase activator NlpD
VAYRDWLTAKDRWGTLAIFVVVDDGNGYRSVYIHLYRSLVKVGQVVAAGDPIGYEGRTGDATGCHLHYSIFRAAETAVFDTDPSLVERHHLPAAEIARIDPFTILPAMSTTALTWGWGVGPSATP